MKSGRSAVRQNTSPNSHSSSDESSVEASQEYGSDAESEESNSVVNIKPKEKFPMAELIAYSPASGRVLDRSNRAHASTVFNASDESSVSQENQVPEILPASEPRLETRIKYFTLGVSAVIGLSMPFIMLLSPKDLANRAAWVGVAASSGLFLGTVYCFVDYAVGLREQIRLQRNAATSPA